MVKLFVYLSFLIFISNAYSMHLNTKTNSNSKFNPKMGVRISMKKNTQDKVSAISFLGEIQNSLGGKFKKCKYFVTNNLKKLIL